MPALQFTTSLIGLGLAVLILVLLRRDHLYIHHGLFWIVWRPWAHCWACGPV
jgi:hypothetical protein